MSFFNSLKVPKPRRSTFNLSYKNLLTTDFGNITPFAIWETLPGDSFRVSSEVFVRLAPMMSPVLSNINLKIEYFFVPTRLLWDLWPDFITGGVDGSKSFPTPKLGQAVVNSFTAAGIAGESITSFTAKGTVAHYLGCPVMKDAVQSDGIMNILPVLAYNKVINDYYIDENFEINSTNNMPYRFDKWIGEMGATQILNVPNGTQGVGIQWNFYQIYNRYYKKDYFTSALPWAQRGPEAVLPFDVPSNTSIFGYSTGSIIGTSEFSTGNAIVSKSNNSYRLTDSSGNVLGMSVDVNNGLNSFLNNSAPSVNEIRRTFAVQDFLERSARFGSRLIEQIFGHFGVKSSDARLQRSEFIKGFTVPVLVSQVLQQSETTADSVLGSMAGHGVSASNNKSFKYYCEEHGYILGLVTPVTESYYYQGIPRWLTRSDRFDYAFPEFDNLGEQSILRQELFYKVGESSKNNEVYGYTPRYADYKSRYNEIHGDFQDSLRQFTTARSIEKGAYLNPLLLKQLGGYLNHIFAVSGSDHFWMEFYNKCHVKRCLSYYGTPSALHSHPWL